MNARRLVAFAIVVSLAGVAAVSADPLTAIVGATLIDGNGGPPVKDAVLLIDGRKISAAGPATRSRFRRTRDKSMPRANLSSRV